jgi:16S rRNA (guanine(966)-N(2))-methyltransferase RsmD
MKITAGIYKGRQIAFPDHIRPTQDKVRQAIFNILGQDFSGLSVLDLFAGSGALGIESYSRGAKNVVFVDIERRCNNCIKSNLETIGLDWRGSENLEVYRQDAEKAIGAAVKRHRVFDLVFVDPPYHRELAKKLLKTPGLNDILTPHGFLVVEHAVSDDLDIEQANDCWRMFKQVDYGNIRITFLRPVHVSKSHLSGDV